MSQDLVTLYNLALSAAGARAAIASEDDDTREGQLCKTWLPIVRDTALRAANWASARRVAQLALQAEASSDSDWTDGDPEPGWTYRYGLPVDYLYPRWLGDYSPFTLCSFNNTTMLQANVETPVLIYTARQTIPGAWDPDLFKAISLGLAAALIMPLSGKADRANVMIADANELILRARVNSANENADQLDSLPDWLLARGASLPPVYNKYIYQTGPLFASGAIL